MPKWSNQPPTRANAPSFRLVRTPADRPIAGIVTSLEFVGCQTHFVHNRTVPCEAEGDDGSACVHCQDGHSWRWHGYLTCILDRSSEHAIFEFTSPPAETFRNYITSNGQLRGCHFQARRPSKRPNGRVVVAAIPGTIQDHKLPQPPNLQKLLCRIWNIQYTATVHKPLAPDLEAAIDVLPSTIDGRMRGNGQHIK